MECPMDLVFGFRDKTRILNCTLFEARRSSKCIIGRSFCCPKPPHSHSWPWVGQCDTFVNGPSWRRTRSLWVLLMQIFQLFPLPSCIIFFINPTFIYPEFFFRDAF